MEFIDINNKLHTLPALNAIVCDLDGTLLHSKHEAIEVPGRTRASFLSAKAALLLEAINRMFPVVIATGRNAKSVEKLVRRLPDVKFKGFVLENGFVVKNKIDDKLSVNVNIEHKIENISMKEQNTPNADLKINYIRSSLTHVGMKDNNSFNAALKKNNRVKHWDDIAAFFPQWERLPFYENCVGFVFDFNQKQIDSNEIDLKEQYAKKILEQNGYNYIVYKEKRKIFIYLDHVDKMKGLALLGVHPYIAIGDGANDVQMIQYCTLPITLSSGTSDIKEIVKEKKGFCSMKTGHDAAYEMLEFAYNMIKKL